MMLPDSTRRFPHAPVATMLLATVLLTATTACAPRAGSTSDTSTPGDSAGSAAAATPDAAAGDSTPVAASTPVAGSTPVAASTPSAAPRLTRITPDTIRLGKGEAPTLTLVGSGFVPGGTGTFVVGANTVRIGRASFDMLPADSAGATIRFAMSLTFPDTAARGRPSSFAPGTFAVSVVTPNGTSNALSLTMIP